MYVYTYINMVAKVATQDTLFNAVNAQYARQPVNLNSHVKDVGLFKKVFLELKPSVKL